MRAGIKEFFTLMSAVLALIFIHSLSAQTRRPIGDKITPLTQAEASERWKEFSQQGNLSDYCMRFTLTHILRKGDESQIFGTILGSQIGDKTYTRIIFDSPRLEYLLLNSPNEKKVWKFENGKISELPSSEWQKPFLKGCIYSPFDILIPYKYWSAKYVGADRIGQAVHYFDATNPDFKNVVVRIALTREFNSPAQVQIFSSDGKKIKTLSLGSIKKVDGVWIMREASLRDDSSRDKDKLTFVRGSFKYLNPQDVFSPSNLGRAVSIPELKRL